MKRIKGITLCVMLMCFALNAQAQFGDILNKVANVVTGGSVVKETDLVGTWTYAGPAVEFTSDNLLSNIGGTVASTKIEEQLGAYMEQVGITAGHFTLTLNEDKSFKASLSDGKNASGTYTLSEDGKLVMNLPALGTHVNAAATMTGDKLVLLLDADKLLSLITTVSNYAGSTNSTIGAVGSLLENYSGMKAGMKFTR